jgi:hypothetical protein
MSRYLLLVAAAAIAFSAASPATLLADELTIVADVPEQPFEAQVKRVVAALDFFGAPLTKDQAAAVDKAIEDKDSAAALQKLLDPLCLAAVNVNPESRVKVSLGPAAKKLVQNGWTVFLVKVHNEAGVTAKLACGSPNAAPLYKQSTGNPDPKPSVKESDVPHRWLDVSMFEKQPLNARPRSAGSARPGCTGRSSTPTSWSRRRPACGWPRSSRPRASRRSATWSASRWRTRARRPSRW